MTWHLLKLIWNRRRTNGLLMVEMFFSFLVLVAVTTMGLFLLDNYRRPLGYHYEDVWCVKMDMKVGGGGGWDGNSAATLRRLEQTLGDLPEVEGSSSAFTAPFAQWGWRFGDDVRGKHIEYEYNEVGDTLGDVLGLEVLRGRFFSRDDDGAAFRPVVLNERLARDVFGDEDPIGRPIPQNPDPNGGARPEMRVVGVVREFRQHGELSAPFNYLFQRQTGAGDTITPPNLLLVKVRPGTTAAFEENLIARLQAVAREWSFTVKPLSEMRAANHRDRLAPVTAISLVSGFLLLMVALGLTGVVWQNVTQRVREIGLRRAKGATARRIHRQILGELAVMTSLALLAGLAIVVQLPLLDLLGDVRPGVFGASLAISIAALYGVTMACGYYPARLATRITPADALRYE
jgi:putative ABC transport system permease protein